MRLAGVADCKADFAGEASHRQQKTRGTFMSLGFVRLAAVPTLIVAFSGVFITLLERQQSRLDFAHLRLSFQFEHLPKSLL